MTIVYKNDEKEDLFESLKNEKQKNRKIFLLNAYSSEQLKEVREVVKEVNRNSGYFIELAENYIMLTPCSEEKFISDRIE